MTFVIITHVSHRMEHSHYFAYGPYVREMNIWGKHIDELIIVAPKLDVAITAIDIQYEHQNIEFVEVDSVDLLSFKAIFSTILRLPKMTGEIYRAMKKADHIHLRCPGNIGLIGCFVQILFPQKTKTAKYAGNWDPKSTQPWSYQLQKWVLRNTFLTRNMQVLVYGEWPKQSPNIKPFFTASYREAEKVTLVQKELKAKIEFIFVGTLVKGKNPFYAVELVEMLSKKGYDVGLSLFGDGSERSKLENYIREKQLDNRILIKGNQTKEKVQEAFKQSHFVVLASASEGWPKAIAEGMFWGCVPVATAVSCVPYMLGYGARGILLEMKLEQDVAKLESLILSQNAFNTMCEEGAAWSRDYTLDVFEQEIKYLFKGKTKIMN
jgi:glycosyltransferase involved in cell wall biosynthesis